MKHYWPGIAALSLLTACGGGVFESEGETGGDGEGSVGGSTDNVPSDIAGDIDSVTFDPDAGTLVMRGVRLDDTPFSTTYVRKPGLDRGDYLAFTAQDHPLSRHFTAFAQERDGVFAVVTASGQFDKLISGASFGRAGSYSAPTITPDTGVVSYAGQYVGLLNVAGAQDDILPVAPGTPNELRPTQIAQITGLVFINADFADNSVEGSIYDRKAHVISGGDPTQSVEVDLSSVNLNATQIADNGSFSGAAELDNDQGAAGSYAGIFGGEGATSVAGATKFTNHIDISSGSSVTIDNAEESGIFVLPSCGSPDADPVCP